LICPVKWCRYCARLMSIDLFHKRSASPDGLSYRCKNCQKQHAHLHYVKNRDATIIASARWAKENPDKRTKIHRRYDRNNRDKKKIYARKWRSLNSEKSRELNIMAAHRRRCAGRLSSLDWRLLRQLANGRCVYCDAPAKLTLDHLTPVSRGGMTTWDNCVPACRSCNSSKNSSIDVDWAYDRFGLEAGRVITFLIMKKSVDRYRRKQIREIRA
jgi:5-methylcytosine-specific restriction endonuclease McrA